MTAPATKAALTSEVSANWPDNTAGQITPALLRSVVLDILNSLQQYPGVNTQTGTSYTVQASDYGQAISFNNANPIAVTLPQATLANGFYPFGFFAYNLGVGTVTITPQVSTINGASSLAVASGNAYYIVSDATNWLAIPLTSGANAAILSANNTFTGNNTFNGAHTVFNGGMVVKTKLVSGGTTSATDSDFLFEVSANAAALIMLLSGATAGKSFYVYDVASNAATSNITVSGNDVNIMGTVTSGGYVINTNAGGAGFIRTSAGVWKVV